MVFKKGDRVRYLAHISDGQVVHYVPGDDVGTIVDTDYDEEYKADLYAVRFDNAPYGATSPFTGQTYGINYYPAEYLIPAEEGK